MSKKRSHTIYLIKKKKEDTVPNKWPYDDWELSCQDVNLIYLVYNEKRLNRKRAEKTIKEISKFREENGFEPWDASPVKVTITFEEVPVKEKKGKKYNIPN